MKICGDKVRLKFAKPPYIVDGIECAGTSEPVDHVITIARDLEPKEAARTLMHEVIEYINEKLGIGLKHNQICALELGFGDFVRENGNINWGNVYEQKACHPRRRLH